LGTEDLYSTFNTLRRSVTTIDEQRRPHRTYHAYLLRLWQETPSTPWRALTRDAESKEERRFATLDQLFLFLHQQTLVPGAGKSSHGPDDEDPDQEPASPVP
jgi:hypothetical protein